MNKFAHGRGLRPRPYKGEAGALCWEEAGAGAWAWFCTVGTHPLPHPLPRIE